MSSTLSCSCEENNFSFFVEKKIEKKNKISEMKWMKGFDYKYYENIREQKSIIRDR